MPAHCYGHALNLQNVGTPKLDGAPLGACWMCGVFGCTAHAERDHNSGKWLCYPSVANAVASSAGVGVSLDEGLPEFASVADLESRFPTLAEETAEERSRTITDPQVSDFLASTRRTETSRALLASAIAIARALIPPETRDGWLTVTHQRLIPEIFPGEFGEVVKETWHG